MTASCVTNMTRNSVLDTSSQHVLDFNVISFPPCLCPNVVHSCMSTDGLWCHWCQWYVTQRLCDQTICFVSFSKCFRRSPVNHANGAPGLWAMPASALCMFSNGPPRLYIRSFSRLTKRNIQDTTDTFPPTLIKVKPQRSTSEVAYLNYGHLTVQSPS